jgi:hypothetical protein
MQGLFWRIIAARRRTQRNIQRNIQRTAAVAAPIHDAAADKAGTLECRGAVIPQKEHISDGFSFHMAKYLGETVTVFVAAGGMAGMGFTGILLRVDPLHARIITGIGPAPSCSLFNPYSPYASKKACTTRYDAVSDWADSGMVQGLGSQVLVPLNRITAFVHNSI